MRVGSETAGAVGLTWTSGGPEQAPAAARLAGQAFDPFYREAWSQSQIAAMAGDPGGWLEMALDEQGGAVAFSLNRQVLEDVELLLIATDPSLRRRGISRQLIGRVCDTAIRRGATRVFLEVRESNIAALGLYQACGFLRCGVRKAYYRTVSGEALNAITLQRHL